jgi:hypothetical protein
VRPVAFSASRVFAEIDTWWGKRPKGVNPFKPDATGHDDVDIELKDGDLLIFNSLLAQRVRPNRSEKKVPMAQCISMSRQTSTTSVCTRRGSGPGRSRLPRLDRCFQVTRELEKKNPIADLNPLGRKFLGLDR